jgi:hypothetical protein
MMNFRRAQGRDFSRDIANLRMYSLQPLPIENPHQRSETKALLRERLRLVQLLNANHIRIDDILLFTLDRTTGFRVGKRLNHEVIIGLSERSSRNNFMELLRIISNNLDFYQSALSDSFTQRITELIGSSLTRLPELEMLRPFIIEQGAFHLEAIDLALNRPIHYDSISNDTARSFLLEIKYILIEERKIRLKNGTSIFLGISSTALIGASLIRKWIKRNQESVV